MKSKAVLGLLSCAILMLAACNSNNDQDEEQAAPEQEEQNQDPMEDFSLDTENYPDIIATVNGEEILNESFVPMLEQQAMMIGMMQQLDFESEEGEEILGIMEQDVANYLVDQLLLRQAADDAGIEVTDEEIEEVLTDFMEQRQIESIEEMEEMLAEQEIELEEIREDIRISLKGDKYLEENIDLTEISEEELQEAYEQMTEADSNEEEEDIPTFEESRENLENELQAQQRQEKSMQLIDELKADSEITIHI